MNEHYEVITRQGVRGWLRWALSFELGMWRSLWRWILRWPPRLPPGAKTFGYSSAVMPALIGFIAVSAIEIPILHLLLPWGKVRIAALVLGAQGLIWMIGFMASLRLHPHAITDDGLRVRHGASIDFTIPGANIAAVRARLRSLPTGKTVQFEPAEPGRVLHIAISGTTNVDVVLREPMRIRLPKGVTRPVGEVRLHADDPAALTEHARFVKFVGQ